VEEGVRRYVMAGENWVLIVPVDELYLTEAVSREFRVDRVRFIDKDKLPRVRKRLGLGVRVSELKKHPWSKELFERSPALAAVRGRGTQKEVEQQCLGLVREELTLLSLSHLGYSRRKQMGPVVPAGEVSHASMSYLLVRSQDMTGRLRWQRTTPIAQMGLDEVWKNHQDHGFFTRLLKILRSEKRVAVSWREELRRASVMVGESVGSNDPFKSFLWNMVALEMLLTKDEKGKMLDILPKRVGALIDWHHYWKADNYEERIKKAYDKRNALLHYGRRDEVTDQDLAFTDHILFNVLTNLVYHPKLFSSKDAFVDFSRRLEAKRTLGVKKPRVRPKTFRFIRPVRPDF
jgi:hypothetical protein